MQNIPWQKIQALQQEARVLEDMVKKKKATRKSKPLSIEGLLKGVKFFEKEIKEAQKAIFSHSASHFE